MAGIVMDHKKVLYQLGSLLESENVCISQIYPDPEMASCKIKKEALNNALAKTGEEFKVLVIGAFSSGKSTMINALIGEELLPTGFLPETAVIGELHYGEGKRIILYPKKGKWEGGDEPFDLKQATTEEISKYVSLTADDAVNTMYEDEFSQNQSQKRIESRFEKMVIYWPLDILKDGVVLVDSPGINDPYSNDYIVNSYLPQADAIVYVMSSINAYQGTDVDELCSINRLGVRNIITGYTWYDAVVKQNRKQPERLQKLRDKLISHMMKHSDLGVRSVHFLSSMEALEAKENHDMEAFRRSGFADFEDYLSHYLVEHKGTDQVKNMAATIILQARGMIKDAGDLDKASTDDIVELDKRIKNAKSELSIVQMNSVNTGNIFRMRMENVLPKVKTMVSAYVDSLADQVDLEGFQPDTKLPTGARKFWPFGANGVRNLAKSLRDECQQEIERRMTIALRSWSNKELSGYLKNAISESVKSIRPNLTQIARELDDINAQISGSTVGGSGDLSNIALGLAYAMLTGDWLTGGMSAVYGKGIMGRAIAFQAAAGVGLGLLMTAGVTITLPVFILTVLLASILAILTNDNEKQVEKIKKQAVKSVREFFANSDSVATREEIVNSVMKQVKNLIEASCDDMDEALRADIKATEDGIQQRINACSADEATKKKQMNERVESVRKLREIERQALEICASYNIPEDFMQFNK